MAILAGLVADIGGTHARFALADVAGHFLVPKTYLCRDHPDLGSALATYLAETGARDPRRAAICVAGPVTDGRAVLTNHPWAIDADGLGIEQVSVVNDFAALALALPNLRADDLYHLGGPTDGTPAPLAVMGPGTGLGVAGLLPHLGVNGVIATEGGHMTAAPRNDAEARIIDALALRFGHVSYERLVSGQGLENIHGVLAAEAGRTDDLDRTAPEITAAALTEDDPLARRALDHFFGFLGSAASDMALALGARGGLFLAGGILPGLQQVLAMSSFHARFIDKGRFHDYLAAVPVHLIVHPNPAFVGLTRLLRARGQGE